MGYYRLYFMSSFSGHIERFEEFAVENDEQAISLAQSRQGFLALELWCSHRKVEQFDALDLASQLLAQRQKLKAVKEQLEAEPSVDDAQPENRTA